VENEILIHVEEEELPVLVLTFQMEELIVVIYYQEKAGVLQLRILGLSPYLIKTIHI
jgi:hypothetical protein